jgi:hypothetical protein
MAESQKTGDYFGTFLDAVKQNEVTPGGEVNDRLRSLLTTLDTGPRAIWDLQEAVSLPFPDFTSELEAARISGYVDLSGPSGKEKVALTPSGRELVSRLKAS